MNWLTVVKRCIILVCVCVEWGVHSNTHIQLTSFKDCKRWGDISHLWGQRIAG